MSRHKHSGTVAGVTNRSFLNSGRPCGRWQGWAAGARSNRWVCTLSLMEPEVDRIERSIENATVPRLAANGAVVRRVPPDTTAPKNASRGTMHRRASGGIAAALGNHDNAQGRLEAAPPCIDERLEAAPPDYYSPPPLSPLPPKKNSVPLCLCGESSSLSPAGATP
jgi:hypothetical protein